MATPVPITPDVLSWAIEEAGLDLAELAGAVGAEPADVESWLRGGGQPNTTVFRKLAKALNRPTVFFLQSSPPVAPSIPPKFRKQPGIETERSLRKEEDKALRLARRMQRVIGWARAEAGYGMPTLPAVSPSSQPVAVSRALRDDLGWTAESQTAATSPGRVFADLRVLLEDRGALIMLLPMGQNSCRGFSLFDAAAPIVAVNSAQTPEARIFSLLHELGHLLRGQDAFDLRYWEDQATERWCDQFAASFLLPQGSLQEYVDRRFGGHVSELTQARTVARHFKASLAATCIQLSTHNLGSSALYGQIPQRDHWKPPSERGFNPDPSTAGKRLRELGTAIVSEIVAAEDHGILRRHDVQRYLHVDDDKYGDLAERIASLTQASRSNVYEGE